MGLPINMCMAVPILPGHDGVLVQDRDLLRFIINTESCSCTTHDYRHRTNDSSVWPTCGELFRIALDVITPSVTFVSGIAGDRQRQRRRRRRPRTCRETQWCLQRRITYDDWLRLSEVDVLSHIAPPALRFPPQPTYQPLPDVVQLTLRDPRQPDLHRGLQQQQAPGCAYCSRVMHVRTADERDLAEVINFPSQGEVSMAQIGRQLRRIADDFEMSVPRNTRPSMISLFCSSLSAVIRRTFSICLASHNTGLTNIGIVFCSIHAMLKGIVRVASSVARSLPSHCGMVSRISPLPDIVEVPTTSNVAQNEPLRPVRQRRQHKKTAKKHRRPLKRCPPTIEEEETVPAVSHENSSAFLDSVNLKTDRRFCLDPLVSRLGQT